MDRFTRQLERYHSAINAGLAGLLTRDRPATMYDAGRYVLKGGGKRVRPLLVIFACEAVGGAWRKAIPAALAVETLHNFTLVHDDIMDASGMRRGRPTVHKKWNDSVAILSGDAMVAVAYRSLLRTKCDRRTEIASLFTEGLLEVCEGQAYDMEFEREHAVSVADYLTMIEKKTGALLKMAASIGGVIGNGTGADIRSLRKFGKYLGLAFQIQDDLLDVVADEAELGKPLFNDIKKGKRTYLLLAAYAHADSRARKVLEKVYRREATDPGIIREVGRIFRETGAVARAGEAVRKYTQKAERSLSALPAGEGRDRLARFAHLLLDRAY